MFGGSIFRLIDKDKFLVSNTGQGKDIDNVIVKFLVKDLKIVLASYGIETKKKKKQELINDFIKLSTTVPKVKEPIKFEPLVEDTVDTKPKKKNIQIQIPKEPIRNDNPLYYINDTDREYALFKMTKPELNKIAKTHKINSSVKRNDMITDILHAEGLQREVDIGNKEDDEDIYKINERNKIELTKKYEKNKERYDRETKEYETKMKEYEKRMKEIREAKKRLKGGVISTDELGKFVEASYKKKGEVQDVNGYKIDNELSTRRNKVYTNDKGEAVVAIAGTDNMKDWSNNLLIPFGLHSQTDRYKNSEETLKKTNAKYGKQKVSVVGHSQSGHIVNDLADRDLIGAEAIAYNPAIIGKTNKKVKVVKSQLDPVSILTQTKKGDVIVKPTSYNPFKYNPLTYHSTKPLKK